MQTTSSRNSLLAVAILIALAALSRLIPHAHNFTACGALALFAGAKLNDRRLAYLLPFSALLISDLILGFHTTLLPVYACFGFIVWLGSRLSKNTSFRKTVLYSLTGSVVFFLITNLPIWYGGYYPLDLHGLLTSYAAGIPFFRNQIIGDLVYTGLLFGSYAFVEKSRLLKTV